MSIWNKFEIKRKYKKLEKNIETDILIIGGGITGLTLGYYLKDKNICIVDAGIIGHGTTLNSTAKINYFQQRNYNKILNLRTKAVAIQYLNSQLFAIKSIKEIIEKEKIECDFKRVDSYVFANTENEILKLDKEIKFLREQKIDVKEKKLPINIKLYKSYYVTDTYIFNPIKYLEGIYKILKKKNISVYEYTKIIKIKDLKKYYECYSSKFKIKAKKVIFACHYPYFLFPFFLPLKSYIEKSYIIVSKTNKDNKFTYISSNNPTYSYRYYEQNGEVYQISLSESHDTSIKQNDYYNFNKVIDSFNLKEKDIVMKYSNTDIITPDYMPYIGKIKMNMYIACGYNTWGMTNGVLAAKIISDDILNIENEYKYIFDPKRITFSHIINIPKILFIQTKSFFGPKINKNKKWYKRVKMVKKDGKDLGIYKDENGFIHTVYNKCPHLGCSLIFNEEEKTWDCPCHSSRFNIDGKCIKGPSNYDISYEEK